MNLIEQYISTATFKLPEKGRYETAKELREFIKTSIDTMDKSLKEEEKIKKILEDLGDRDDFIAKYYRKKEE